MISQDPDEKPRKIGRFASELQLSIQAFTATANEKTQRSTAQRTRYREGLVLLGEDVETSGKSVEISGKCMEIYGTSIEICGKSMESLWKSVEQLWKTSGKSIDCFVWG